MQSFFVHSSLHFIAEWSCSILLAGLLVGVAGCKTENDSIDSTKKPDSNRSVETEKHYVPIASDLSAAELYNVHCMTCHGETGNADGPGSKSVYPLPRNFRRDRFKVVSSENLLPDIDDFQKVIAEGMPGTSMVAFDKLHPDDHRKLASEVMRLWQDGTRERLIAEAKADREELDEETLKEMVAQQTTAKRKVDVPDFDMITADSILRGRAIYFEKSCQSCHGEDGRGSKTIDLTDEHGQSIRPRDLVNEPYKCGDDRESIFLCIKLGIPGTPHPSNMSLTDQQLVDLTHYVQSIRADKKVILTGHQRRNSISVRDYLRQLDQFPREQ